MTNRLRFVLVFIFGLAAFGTDAAANATEVAPALAIDFSGSSEGASAQFQNCKPVDAGDDLQADLYILNVEKLTAWELRIDYDPNVIAVEAANFDFFLVENPASGRVSPKLFVNEGPGRVFLGAAEARSAETGSGVLARLDIKAVGNGRSGLTIVAQPAVYGPRLTDAGGLPIGDTNGDGIWDGAVTGGTVSVGQSCAASTPVVTPAPNPGEGPTPRPSATPRSSSPPKPQTTGEPSDGVGTDDTDGDGSNEGEGSVVGVIEPGGGPRGEPSSDERDGTADREGVQDPGESNPGADPAEDPDKASGDGDREADESSNPAVTNSEDDSGNMLVLVIGVMAAVAVALGGLLLLLWRRGFA